MDNFTFEETQLLINFLSGATAHETTKESIIDRLVNAVTNTDDSDLISIAESTIHKFRFLDDKTVKELIDSLPDAEVE